MGESPHVERAHEAYLDAAEAADVVARVTGPDPALEARAVAAAHAYAEAAAEPEAGA